MRRTTFPALATRASPAAPVGAARTLAALLLVALLAGCAGMQRPPGVLHFGMEDAPEGKRVFFPPPPEIPRYSYAGQLVGEQNFVIDRQKESTWQSIWRVIAGLGHEEQLVELARPQGIVTDARKRIVVADVGQPSVRVFDPVDGRLHVWPFATRGETFSAPVGVAAAPDGSFFVADSALGVIAHLDPEGRPLDPIGLDQLVRPTGVALAGQRLYVADSALHQIRVFDLQTRALVAEWGERGNEPGHFMAPTFLAVRGQELYVADTLNARIQVLDAERGTLIRAFGTRGSQLGQFMLPKGLAFDAEDNLYVVDSFFDTLLIFNVAGDLLLNIGGAGYATGAFQSPSAVWVDDANRVYLADTFNGRVALFQFLGGD